jgi:hypothetical protein
MRWFVCLGIFWVSCLPYVSVASVRINEVAWMGTTESYLCNWVELYNQSSTPVDVTEWTLEIDDTVRPLEEGDGKTATVPSRGFLVLERVTNTCPDAVPGVFGWSIALGNLPNSGATLTLRRADDTVADQVAGGTDWQNIGGDNDSKETAQRTSAGWVTAPATPGAKNQDSKETTPKQETKEKQSANTTSKTTTNTTKYRYGRSGGTADTEPLGTNDHALELEISGPRTTYVGQPMTLSVTPSGVGDGVAQSLHYQWNWGDRHTTTKPNPTHAYAFPGTYVVTVRGTYADYEAVTRHEITVLPVRLSIERDQANNIQIQNTAPYELNLSGYTVTGTRAITFPARSISLAKQTVTIQQNEVENGIRGLVTIKDAQGKTIASNFTAVEARYQTPTVVANVSSAPPPRPMIAGTAWTSNRPSHSNNIAQESESSSTVTTTASSTATQFLAQPPVAEPLPSTFQKHWRTYWPYGALVGLILLAAWLLLWPTRRQSHTQTNPDLFT